MNKDLCINTDIAIRTVLLTLLPTWGSVKCPPPPQKNPIWVVILNNRKWQWIQNVLAHTFISSLQTLGANKIYRFINIQDGGRHIILKIIKTLNISETIWPISMVHDPRVTSVGVIDRVSNSQHNSSRVLFPAVTFSGNLGNNNFGKLFAHVPLWGSVSKQYRPIIRSKQNSA